MDTKGAKQVNQRGAKKGQGTKRITVHLAGLKRWDAAKGCAVFEKLPPWTVLEGAPRDAAQTGRGGGGRSVMADIKEPKDPSGAQMVVRLNEESYWNTNIHGQWLR